jgi:hypothetical protein
MKTKEELDEMNRKRRKKSYEKHKEEEKSKSLDRYYKKKLNVSITDGDKPFISKIEKEKD